MKEIVLTGQVPNHVRHAEQFRKDREHRTLDRVLGVGFSALVLAGMVAVGVAVVGGGEPSFTDRVDSAVVAGDCPAIRELRGEWVDIRKASGDTTDSIMVAYLSGALDRAGCV